VALENAARFPLPRRYDGWMFAWKIMAAVWAASMDGEAIRFPQSDYSVMSGALVLNRNSGRDAVSQHRAGEVCP